MSELFEEFKRQIYLGSGADSQAQIGLLYQLLSASITIIGGIQQPPMCTEQTSLKQHLSDYDEGMFEVKQKANQIYLALTGEKVVQTRKARK